MSQYYCTGCRKSSECATIPRRCSNCYRIGTISEMPEIKPVDTRGSFEVPMYPTPFKALNAYLSHQTRDKGVLPGGFSSKGITLLGGPPNIGKSIFLIQLVEHLGKLGKKCACAVTEAEALERYKRELSHAENVTILNVASRVFNDVDTFVSSVKPDVLVIDSIDMMWTHLDSYGPMGARPSQNENMGSHAQTAKIIKDLDKNILPRWKIPVYAAAFVEKKNPLVFSGLHEKFYLATDGFIINHSEGEQSCIKEFYVKKRKNHSCPPRGFYLRIRKQSDGRFEDITPGCDVRDIPSVERRMPGSVLCASLSEAKFLQLVIGEMVLKQPIFGDNIKSESLVPDRELQRVKACMELLQIPGENMKVQSSIPFDPLCELAVLAASYSMQQNKFPGAKALFIGQVDLNGNILPFEVGPWVADVQIPFDCFVIGNFSKLKYPFTRSQVRPITHIQELEHIFNMLSKAGGRAPSAV